MSGSPFPPPGHDHQDPAFQYRLPAEGDAYPEQRAKACPQPLSLGERVRRAGATADARNAAYGANYKTFAAVVLALFPNGLPRLRTAEEVNRFATLFQMLSKLTRYAANFETGGHYDSAHDIIVYAAMLEEFTTQEQ